MIKFKNVPIDGVKENSQDGHYIDMRGDFAQIITVGAHPGVKDYEFALPGYRIISISMMPHEDPEIMSNVFDTRLIAR